MVGSVNDPSLKRDSDHFTERHVRPFGLANIRRSLGDVVAPGLLVGHNTHPTHLCLLDGDQALAAALRMPNQTAVATSVPPTHTAVLRRSAGPRVKIAP